MAKIYLGIRKNHIDKNGNVSVNAFFYANGVTTTHSLDVSIKPENWDSDNRIITSKEPNFREKNAMVLSKYDKIVKRFVELQKSDRVPENASKLRNLVTKEIKYVSFYDHFEEVIKNKSKRNAEIYGNTLKNLKLYFSKLDFDDIDKAWLGRYYRMLIRNGSSVNSASLHLRNIRHVFNDAIDNRIVSLALYPFRGYRIPRDEVVHRNLMIQDFRKLLLYVSSPAKKGSGIKRINAEHYKNYARDMFMLSFFLVGINPADMYYLEKGETAFYKRKKTHKTYNIKIPNEAVEIINRHSGTDRMIDASERYGTVHSFFNSVNKFLKQICLELKIPVITMYSARHSWATFAYEVGYKKHDIAICLGHGKKSVTDTYIESMIKLEEDSRFTHEANLKVIKYVHRRISRKVKKFTLVRVPE